MVDYKNFDKDMQEFAERHEKEVISKVRHGISNAINQLKEETKSSLSSANPPLNVNSPMSEGASLMEGIKAFMDTTVDDTHEGIVHILGNRKINDGTWRLRFFEGGTQTRYDKRRRRSLGAIKSRWFFRNQVDSAQSVTENSINHALTEAINNINK